MVRFSRSKQIGEAEFNPERKTLVTSDHLGNKDLTRICKELTGGFAMNWMQGNAENNKKRKRKEI